MIKKIITFVVITGMFCILAGCSSKNVKDVAVQTKPANELAWKEVTKAAPFSARHLHQVVIFEDKMWLFGGMESDGTYKADVWSSSDGINWSEVTSNGGFTSSRGTSFVLDNKIWFIASIGETINDPTQLEIWNTSDGITWEQVKEVKGLPALTGVEAVVFEDKVWLMAGANIDSNVTFYNDIWYSSDGINWEKGSGEVGFSKRDSYSTTVFNKKIWMIAGQSGAWKSMYNDVWSSTDGNEWIEITPTANFLKRHCTQVVTHDNKLWIIGGFAASDSGPIFVNDTWYSEDGKNWTQLNSEMKFETRIEFKAIEFKNKIWVIGGLTGSFDNFQVTNDIWCLE